MRKIAGALLALALVLSLAGCGEKELSEAGLRAMLDEKVNQEILDFKYDDYDGDGVFEAFAFVGEEGPPEGFYGALWFIDAKGAQELEASEYGYSGHPGFYTFGQHKFAVLDEYRTTGGYVHVWGVHGGKPRLESISGVGGGFTQLDGNNFTLYHSTYDIDETDGVSTGHTWKNYWFLWDGENFREHGGVPLAEKELRKLGGAAEVLDGIDGVVGEIFYRGSCGVVNVNYTVPGREGSVTNHYVTLQLKDGRAAMLEEGEGRYQAALAPEIAVYPKEPVTFA
ncbi:MAG: hypothetical protein FWC27_02175 [Firmicutes bacterium]|nr:hypothetical protein [Bacillota bacterium]